MCVGDEEFGFKVYIRITMLHLRLTTSGLQLIVQDLE